jgi:hypothetical protein
MPIAKAGGFQWALDKSIAVTAGRLHGASHIVTLEQDESGRWFSVKEEPLADISETPESDKEAFVATYDYWKSTDAVRLKFSERMERERNQARFAAEHWRRVAAKNAGCTEHECDRLPWEETYGKQKN